MGWTDLCLAREMWVPAPLAAARGFVFASVHTQMRPGVDYDQSVCSYQGLRLKPLDALNFRATLGEAFVPSSEAEPALVAMNVPLGGPPAHDRNELRVISMSADGDFHSLYREELPAPVVGPLFHPSRRLLYVVDAASRLRAFAVDGSGRVELTMTIEGAGGGLAITTPK